MKAWGMMGRRRKPLPVSLLLSFPSSFASSNFLVRDDWGPVSGGDKIMYCHIRGYVTGICSRNKYLLHNRTMSTQDVTGICLGSTFQLMQHAFSRISISAKSDGMKFNLWCVLQRQNVEFRKTFSQEKQKHTKLNNSIFILFQ